MTQSISLKIKVRDFAIGFFGWVILDNIFFILTFLVLLYRNFSSLLWLPGVITIITILVLFIRKRIWIGTGVICAVIINAGIWLTYMFQSIHSSNYLSVLLIAFSLPLPSGMAIFLISQ